MGMLSRTTLQRAVASVVALVFGGAVVAPVLGVAVAGAAAPSPRPPVAASSARTQAPSTTPAAATYYVAIGASESLGVQPSRTSRRGVPTNQGYANTVLATQRDRWTGLRLVHFGCPGITVQAALAGGGPCGFAAGSEVAAAVSFLRSHPGRTVLATVDLGFNDLWPCLVHSTVDAGCVTAALARVSRDLPVVLRELRAAGGPRLTVVGLLHNDPYLAAYLGGPKGRQFSAAALSVVNRFNLTLTGIYLRAGVQIANVATAFSLGTSASTVVAGHWRMPVNVAKVCTLSWMCRTHNLHLNAAGYRAVASAITTALPPMKGEAR